MIIFSPDTSYWTKRCHVNLRAREQEEIKKPEIKVQIKLSSLK